VACGKPTCTQSAFGNPTGTKPESKLWLNRGLWWAVMWDTASGDYHIFWLDRATEKWKDTGTTVDGRRTSRSDVVSVGDALYIASHRFAGASEAVGSQALLRRFVFNPSTRKYSLDFTGTISNARTETLVIDRDSSGTFWATWTQASGSGRDVMVAHSGNKGKTWSAATNLGPTGADDISSVIAFGNRVGVMWNNGSFFFRVHPAGAAGSWSPTPEIAWTPAGGADDHINLKADSSGQVYAAAKSGSTGASHIRLLVRSAGGTWSDFAVSDNQGLSRPIVQLHGGNIRVFANGPSQQSGTIYQKAAGSPAGLAGAGLTQFIEKGSGPTGMVDATSTKQNIPGATGLVVLASNEDDSTYWHNHQGVLPVPSAGGGTDRGPNVIRGTRGADVLVGTRKRDIIIGAGGNDRLLGRRGNDTLRGGNGRDRLVGGAGRDKLLGGGGRDTLVAKDRTRDVLNGGGGRDRAHRDRRLDRVRSIEAFF